MVRGDVERLVRSAMSRTLEGAMPKASVALAVLMSLGALVFGIASGRTGGDVERVAPLVAGLLGWGVGVLICFAASLRAFDRDRDDGWVALLARHGARPTAYLAARIVGLGIITLAIVAAGTLASGLGAALASHDRRSATLAIVGTLAGLAYAVAFALAVAPIAIATLGPRGRASGYLFLLSVLVVPALVSHWTGQLVPDEWSELVSVPGALDALRESLLGSVDAARLVRSLAVIIAASALASLWAHAQLRLRNITAEADRAA